MTVQLWATVAADNNSSPPTGAPEGMAASAVNNTLREMMASTAIEAQVNRVKVLNSVSGTNTITGSMTPALTAYSAGMTVSFNPAVTNTGAVTININSLGALDIFRYNGDALEPGDLVAGIPAYLILDSGADDFYLMNPQNIGFRNLPRNNKTGNYTLLISDAGRMIRSGSGTNTFTIPAAASVAFDVGTAITFVNESGSTLAIAITSDTLTLAGTSSTGSRSLVNNGLATAVKTGGATWLISGTGLS